MRIIHSEHISKRNPPENLKQEDLTLFSHEFTKTIRETHLLKLKNIYVFDEVMFSPGKFRFYHDYTHIHPFPTKYLIKKLLLITRKKETIDKGLWITDIWSKGYYHWVMDALTRLVASEQFRGDYPLLLPSDYQDVEYIRQALELLGVKALYFDSSRPLRVKNLLLTSHTSLTGNYNRTLVNDLRSKFLAHSPSTGNRKIYVSRQKAHFRKITNEDQVSYLLKNFNYEIHYFEKYSFKKQIEIMAEAKSLIGLHGAGLTNMLFMRESGQILELRNRTDALNNCYYSLASALNHKYYYQLCDGNMENTHKVDVTVDLAELERNLQMMEAAIHQE